MLGSAVCFGVGCRLRVAEREGRPLKTSPQEGALQQGEILMHTATPVACHLFPNSLEDFSTLRAISLCAVFGPSSNEIRDTHLF